MGAEQNKQPRIATESFEMKWSDNRSEERNHHLPWALVEYDHSPLLAARRRTAAVAEDSNRRDTKQDGAQMDNAAFKNALDFLLSCWCGLVFLCCCFMICFVLFFYLLFQFLGYFIVTRPPV